MCMVSTGPRAHSVLPRVAAAPRAHSQTATSTRNAKRQMVWFAVGVMAVRRRDDGAGTSWVPFHTYTSPVHRFVTVAMET